MNDRSFSAVSTRASASLSRRASLIGLGVAAASSLAAPETAAKKGKKKSPKKCKKQESQCEAPVSAMCERNDIPAEICEEAFLRCCRFFKTCDAGKALDCLSFNAGPP